MNGAGKNRGGRWFRRLFRRAQGLVPADVAGRLAELERAVQDLALDQGGAREAVEKLEKAWVRSGKEQFKANALAEARHKGVEELLEQARRAEDYRRREVARLREEGAGARRAGRLELVESLLPVLDGLDEALISARRLLPEGAKRILRAKSPAQRLRAAVGRLLLSSPPEERLSPRAVEAWLEGVALVRERFLEVLAAEGVQPIEAEGASFDAHRHVAVERVVVQEEGEAERIVREVRRGYAAGERVLRYAEVVVARPRQESARA